MNFFSFEVSTVFLNLSLPHGFFFASDDSYKWSFDLTSTFLCIFSFTYNFLSLFKLGCLKICHIFYLSIIKNRLMLKVMSIWIFLRMIFPLICCSQNILIWMKMKMKMNPYRRLCSGYWFYSNLNILLRILKLTQQNDFQQLKEEIFEYMQQMSDYMHLLEEQNELLKA